MEIQIRAPEQWNTPMLKWVRDGEVWIPLTMRQLGGKKSSDGEGTDFFEEKMQVNSTRWSSTHPQRTKKTGARNQERQSAKKWESITASAKNLLRVW